MIKNYPILASLARTVTGNSLDFTNDDAGSIGAGTFCIDITAASGTTPTLVVTIQGQDPTSGKYYTLLASAVLNAAGTTILRVGPGLPVTANVSANDIIPKVFRVLFTIGGTTPSFTFTVGASVV